MVSADNIAATVKAWDKQPYSFASIRVLESDGSNGSSARNQQKNSELLSTSSFSAFSTYLSNYSKLWNLTENGSQTNSLVVLYTIQIQIKLNC